MLPGKVKALLHSIRRLDRQSEAQVRTLRDKEAAYLRRARQKRAHGALMPAADCGRDQPALDEINDLQGKAKALVGKKVAAASEPVVVSLVISRFASSVVSLFYCY